MKEEFFWGGCELFGLEQAFLSLSVWRKYKDRKKLLKKIAVSEKEIELVVVVKGNFCCGNYSSSRGGRKASGGSRSKSRVVVVVVVVVVMLVMVV